MSHQFFSFLIAGAASALVHWASRVLLSLWVPFHWALPVAYGIALVTGFTLFSFFVFDRSKKLRSRQARDYVLLNIVMLPIVVALSLLINNVLVESGFTNHTEEIAHALAIVSPLIFTYLLNKYVVFKDTQ